MRTTYNKLTLEASIQLVQEWQLSGLTQAAFAETKGMTRKQFFYQIGRVRRLSPETLSEASTSKVNFVSVPQEYLNVDPVTYGSTEVTDQPVIMIQTRAANLQVSNQVDPYLLKTALEVILSC